MELDLGFRGDLTLTSRCIREISSKTWILTKPMYGVRGKEYPTNLYRIPNIKIGSMTFIRPLLQETSTEFVEDSVFVRDRRKPSAREPGRIGWELFYHVNLLIDIKHSRIAFCDSLDTLKKQGYAIENFVKTPLFLERGLIEVKGETPHGPLRCVLDTGATWNILHAENSKGEKPLEQLMWDPENVLEYPSFKFGRKDFGPITFHRFPIQIPIPVEAVLGMEFFKEHLVFLNFAQNCAYFFPPPLQ